MALYLNYINFSRVSRILFPLLFFATSCQLNQSLEKIKTTLFVEEEKKEIFQEDKSEEIETKEGSDISSSTDKPENNDQLFIPDKIEDDKRILDFIESKNKPKELNETLFEQKKVEDEKRILDFFTGFFSSDDEESKKIEADNINKDKKEKIVLKKPSGNFDAYESKIENNNDKNLGNLNVDVNEKKDEIIIVEDDENFFDDDEEDFYAEIDKNDNLSKEQDQSISETVNEEKIENQNFVFLDPRKTIKDPDRKVRKTKNNYVGLLLPLTGEKRSAGSLVLNTFRYSLANKPMDIVFKIYDTKGTVEGAIDAALKGKKDKVETFIGPIFSYETKALKRRFSNDNSMVFFSLSPDLSNISDNIIVSGQNPKDQISCIISDLKFKDIKDLLLIHHKDRYGEIIKESVQDNLRTLNLKNINISFLELDNKKDLNREIKSISHFEKRKNILKAKINQISDDQTIPKNEKKRMLKRLERQLTIDSPFDAIIIASEGDKLLEILSHLAFYDINANNTFVYGTSLWEDTLKTDPVFENTFFVTNLKKRSESFTKNYRDVFSKSPTSVNFHLFDLIDFVNEFKFYDEYSENKIHEGRFTNSQVKSGSLKRETYIKKNKGKNLTEKISSCRLDVI